MPLVLMCGIPCSGKSQRAQQLREHLETECEVRVVDEFQASASFDRSATFAVDSREKELRGQLRSEVQKSLTKDSVLILDASNYIKGFRYELYCLSKACKTTHCVVWCDISSDRAWTANLARPPTEAYTRDIFDALCMRFEAPNSASRWDSPLFTVQPDDKLPLKEIGAALLQRKAPPPNLATQCQPLLATSFLYDLDRVTQEVVRRVLDAQKMGVVTGEELVIDGSTATLCVVRKFTPMELARLRRQYIVYTKMHPVEDCDKLATMFVQYLNSGMLQ